MSGGAANGSVGVLNVGAGDTKLSFDPNNPQERIRAARIVADMLKRGYALLVEVERDGVKKFERALGFREDTCEYIIADFDPLQAAQVDEEEAEVPHEEDQPAAETALPEAREKAPAPKRRGRRKAVDAGTTRAVAVARSAGG